MTKERLLYPCYFDARLRRSEGRRVAMSLAVDRPANKDVYKAVRRLGLKAASEAGSHPAFWAQHGGRVRVAYEGSKEELLRKTAEQMKPPK